MARPTVQGFFAEGKAEAGLEGVVDDLQLDVGILSGAAALPAQQYKIFDCVHACIYIYLSSYMCMYAYLDVSVYARVYVHV